LTTGPMAVSIAIWMSFNAPWIQIGGAMVNHQVR